MCPSRKNVFYLNLGRTGYEKALSIQKELMKARQKNLIKDILILLEHPPVITIGASGDKKNIIATPEILDRKGISIHKTDRGGDVTYHGFGQMIGYLIFSLEEKDIKKFVRKIENSIIKTLEGYDIEAIPNKGVWVNNKKIAAIGLEIKKWTTMHGFALNVDPDMSHFRLINPCGYQAKRTTSLAKLLNRKIPMSDVREKYIKNFSDTFERKIKKVSLKKIRSHINGNE